MRDYATVRNHLLWDLEPYRSDDSGYLSDTPVLSAMAKALADSFYKKLCPLGNSKEADQRALEKFLMINNRISKEPFEFTANNESESCFWDYFRNAFNVALSFDVGGTNYDLAFITEHMGVGPGAAQLADASSMVSKLFEGPISYSTDEYLIPLYRSALAGTGLWADAEHLRFSRFPFTRVEGGKVFFASKNAEISRTCCTEANLNMLIQKSIGDFYEDRLIKHFGINLSTQPDFNREFARKGSIDGSFGTIDLVSASDSISWQLFCTIKENDFLKAATRMSRSEFAVLPDGKKVSMNMISTMGNGFTFPLQTIIFASAVRACYQVMGFPSHCPKTQFGVFGDDIVVRQETYDFVCRMLSKLGFEVNVAKSFNTGPFRESCGSDYFYGHNIRGVYVKTLETPQAIYSVINRLMRWSARTGIPLIRTIGYLKGLVRKVLVPPSSPDDCGIHVPFKLTRPSVDASYWFKYRYYKRVTRRQEMPEPDESINPYGSGLGYLGGHIRRRDNPLTVAVADQVVQPSDLQRGFISLRDGSGRKPRYKIARDSIPWWDWPGLNNQKQSSPWDYPERGARDSPKADAWESACLATYSFE